MEEDKSKKCNQHQGKQFLSEPLLFFIFTLMFIFTPDIYIGYRSTWSVIIGIGPEKRVSVDPYYSGLHYTQHSLQEKLKRHWVYFVDKLLLII